MLIKVNLRMMGVLGERSKEELSVGQIRGGDVRRHYGDLLAAARQTPISFASSRFHPRH